MNLFNNRLRFWAGKSEKWYHVAGFLQLSKNKGVEWEISLQSPIYDFFEFALRWDRKVDHAGLHFRFGVLWFEFTWDLYDFRHWNYDTDAWETYDENDYPVSMKTQKTEDEKSESSDKNTSVD